LNPFTLENEYFRVVILDYGALLHQLWVKDKHQRWVNVVMGLDTPEAYLTDTWSRGAVIGRFAGRLENPIAVQQQFHTIEHEKGVMLHSGSGGWGSKFWTVHTQKATEISLSYTCAHGTTGFPGTVEATLTYQLKDSDLILYYAAQADQPTHINLTNHAYFNLNPSGKIASQELTIAADSILELKNSLVPTGNRVQVDQTPYDFRIPKKIASLSLDDYYVLNKKASPAASLYASETGILMETKTDQPGIVVFTPPHFEAICFETQKFSNTPNIESFPTTLVVPNKPYKQKTVFTFSIPERE